jgi:hypothetical protein
MSKFGPGGQSSPSREEEKKVSKESMKGIPMSRFKEANRPTKIKTNFKKTFTTEGKKRMKLIKRFVID